MRSPIRQREDDDDAPSAQGLSKILHTLQNAGPFGRNVASGPTFSGDRAFLELQRKLLLTPTGVPEPPLSSHEETARGHSPVMFWRFFSLFAVIAAIVAWGIVLLPSFTKTVANGLRQDAVAGKGALLVSAEAKPVQAVAEGEATAAGIQTQVAAVQQSQPRIVGRVPISDPIAAAAPPKPADLEPAARTVSAAAQAEPTLIVAQASPAPPATPLPTMTPGTTAPGTMTPGTMAPRLAGPPAQPANAPPVADASPAATSPANISSSQPVPTSAMSARQRPAPVQNSAALDSAELALLLERGKSFLSVGDISSAQLLFRRAAEAGSAEAALALASTYDPHYLAEHHVVGVTGDEEKARLWYQRALNLGSPEANHLLAQLSQR